MGQARDRGSFEERKAEAIAQGRIKKEKPKPKEPTSFVGLGQVMAYLSALRANRYSRD